MKGEGKCLQLKLIQPHKYFVNVMPIKEIDIGCIIFVTTAVIDIHELKMLGCNEMVFHHEEGLERKSIESTI